MNPFTVTLQLLGVTEATGLVYGLYRERQTIERHAGMTWTAFGLILVLLMTLVLSRLSPVLVHSLHAVAIACIALGLGMLMVAESTDIWDPDLYRLTGEHESWMTEMDHDILAYLDASNGVLSPSILSYNLEYSRESVNRHLRRLEDRGYVERVDRGKYRLAYRHGVLTLNPLRAMRAWRER